MPPDPTDPQTAAFVAEHRCSIASRLHQIHRASRARDRFVVVAARDRGQAYVQCLFQDQDQRMLCEAASGWYYDLPGQPPRFRVGPAGRDALARLGFDSSARTGNYQRWIATPTPDSFDDVATLMLRALREGYGTPRRAELEFTAPLAPVASCDRAGAAISADPSGRPPTRSPPPPR